MRRSSECDIYYDFNLTDEIKYASHNKVYVGSRYIYLEKEIDVQSNTIKRIDVQKWKNRISTEVSEEI